MRSSLNDGYSYGNPAKAWQHLRQLIERVENRQSKLEQQFIDSAVRLTTIEEKLRRER